MYRRPGSFDLAESFTKRHLLGVTKRFTVFHLVTSVSGTSFKKKILTETTGWSTEFVELSLHLQSLQLYLIVDLCRVGSIIGISSRVGDWQDHVLAKER